MVSRDLQALGGEGEGWRRKWNKRKRRRRRKRRRSARPKASFRDSLGLSPANLPTKIRREIEI